MVTVILVNKIPVAIGGYATTPKGVEIDIDNGLAVVRVLAAIEKSLSLDGRMMKC